MESLVRYRYWTDEPDWAVLEPDPRLAEIAAYKEDRERSADDFHSVPDDPRRAAR